jgi:hypothetical protein
MAPVEKLLANKHPESMQVKAWKSYPKDHAPSKVRPMSIVALPRVPMDAEIGKQS